MPLITKESTDTAKVALALTDFIVLIDYWRPSWKSSCGYSSMYPEHRLERYDPDFPRDILSWIKEYPLRNSRYIWGHFQTVGRRFGWAHAKEEEKEIKMAAPLEPLKEERFIVDLFFILIVGGYILAFIMPITYLDYLLEDHPLLFMLMGTSILLFSFILVSYLWGAYYKVQSGRIYNSDLFRMAQRTIDYAREYFKKNNIDPKDFPMELAFTDYQGLTYEKKGRRYRTVIKVD